ncbi:4851_t:CDS:1, partial [Entrophospora sp. SA101]
KNKGKMYNDLQDIQKATVYIGEKIKEKCIMIFKATVYLGEKNKGKMYNDLQDIQKATVYLGEKIKEKV